MAVNKETKQQISVTLLKEYIMMLEAEAYKDNTNRGPIAGKIIADHYNNLSEEKRKQLIKSLNLYKERHADKEDECSRAIEMLSAE